MEATFLRNIGLTFNELHDIMPQKIELFLISNPTSLYLKTQREKSLGINGEINFRRSLDKQGKTLCSGFDRIRIGFVNTVMSLRQEISWTA
jgi:hypothetical protein